MSRTLYPKGSEWRKWDLHVHTPYSIIQHYGNHDEDETWNKFITDLENLPSEYSVIGINDYLFIDGYERLLNEQRDNNRLQNLTLLPVLEFRIQAFAGVEFTNTSRINYHVIFSNQITPDIIKSQFLSTLNQYYTLNNKKWCQCITKDSLTELGKLYYETIPEGRKPPPPDFLELGFNSLNINHEDIQNSLSNNSNFNSKYLTAIGKTEWSDLRWTDGSGAFKHSLINSTDIVFTAAENLDKFNRSKQTLKAQNVNDLLLDCSDAHYFSNSVNSNRIGNSFTWIKADPTFEGLKQITIKPNDRVFVGNTPQIITRVKFNKTKYLKSLEIKHKDDYDTEKLGIWFNNISIQLNSELTAIIGNKGSGKSAVTDILALCANLQPLNFSFLNAERFHNKQLSSNFEARLTKHAQDEDNCKSLDEDNYAFKDIEPVIRYLPQHQFEQITNETNSISKFTTELNKVVFSHIPNDQKRGATSFDSLISLLSSSNNEQIDSIKRQIHILNSDIAKLEEFKRPDYIDSLNLSIRKLEEEYNALQELPPVSDPKSTQNTSENTSDSIKLNTLYTLKTDLETQISTNNSKIASLTKQATIFDNINNSLSTKVTDLNSYLSELTRTHSESFTEYDINIADIVSVDFNSEKFLTAITQINDIKAQLEAHTGTSATITDSKEETLTAMLQEINNEITVITSKLSSQQQEYQQYINENSQIIAKKEIIMGSTQVPYTEDTILNRENRKEVNTIRDYQDLQSFINHDLSHIISLKYEERSKLTNDIYDLKLDIVQKYNELAEGIITKLNEYSFIKERYNIEITPNIIFDNNFPNNFLNYIHQGRKGTYCSRSRTGDPQIMLHTATAEFSPENKNITTVINKLYMGLQNNADASLSNADFKNQFKSNNYIDLYNYLYSLDYLQPQFKLQQDNKDLSQLSPGERGALLLVFYLILDESEIPLILDQPEDNLDNFTVAKILVDFVKIAKSRRQIILVTHNPNLAVYADAEQIIHVNIDKQNGNKFKFISGSIEEPKIKDKIIEVLEGTMPAFNNRRDKYNL